MEEQAGTSSPPRGRLEDIEVEGELQDVDLSDGEEKTTETADTSNSTGRTSPASDTEEVDWEQLQKTEDQESKEQDSDNTALLLARLEQENAKIATNPKSIKVQVVDKRLSATRRPRPPSMAQLKDMVHAPTPPALRYSMLPPPPMTDLEFYAALVKDYQQTAARLPTLLSNKIRKGVPPPLRGVVWQSMTGARDSVLEEQFERFCGESSPYEGIISKDLGRSFPGVDMFRDPEGDGQRMLGRVLKCYSLHEPKIGYCQGLAFLVGPLLMHMPDKQAFCVLVKLMEDYDLRSSYTPDLIGLHVRIHQFKELLQQHLPALSSHMDDLQVDPAYVSQWFLSFFAVTCPLPMLFRIYDVIFAEGASETIMRVALSLMQKNQGRILACTEMEDVMQLLLSRGLWDCYHYNADEFVRDFTGLSNVVTRERLAALEQGYRESQIANHNSARTSDVTSAASRFLGRLWSSSSNNTKSVASASTLSPTLSNPLRPLSMLRRSTSKQSIASTLNSMEATTSSSSSVLTEATTVSRDSSASDNPTRESTVTSNTAKLNSVGGGGNSNSDTKYLHSQIEDLLTALSDLQRQHALLADQLQREREERSEDKKAVRSLLDGLRKKAGAKNEVEEGAASDSSEETIKGAPQSAGTATEDTQLTAERLSELLDVVEERLGDKDTDKRRSSISQTKHQLRDDLARTKEQLANELAKSQDGRSRIRDVEQEMATVKDQLRESHTHVRSLHQEKQRLEKQIHTMRVRASDQPATTTAASAASAVAEAAGDWFGRTNTGASPGKPGGLRELKLGRSKSTPSQASPYNKRLSSMPARTGAPPPGTEAPSSEHEALLLELVQAKTAEAIARQEADEAKQKLESMRKALGLAPGETPPATTAASQASAAASAAMSMLGRLTTSTGDAASKTPAAGKAAAAPATPAAAAPASAVGGFFGWRR